MSEHLHHTEQQIERFDEQSYDVHDAGQKGRTSGGMIRRSIEPAQKMPVSPNDTSESISNLVNRLAETKDIEPVEMMAEVISLSLKGNKRPNRTAAQKKAIGAIGELVVGLVGDNPLDQLSLLFEAGNQLGERSK